MLKENISLTQLFALIVNYVLGTSIVTGVGREAMQDTWIALMIATFIGMGLMYFYYSFNILLPNKNLYDIMEYCFTRLVAIGLSFVYITYFLYLSGRVVRGFTELMHSAVLAQTPVEVIIFVIILVFVYITYLGLEVIARVTEVFTPYVLGLSIILFILLFSSRVVELHNLQPVLGDGLKPILKALYPSLTTFPYGELVIFTVILSNASQLKESKKVALIGVLIGGILVIGSILMVTTLGAEGAKYSSFPMLSAGRRVAIGEFIERIDVVVVIIMMFGVLIKGTLYLYVGLKGLEYVFRLSFRYFTFPMAMLVSITAIQTSPTLGEFSYVMVKSTLPIVHPSAQLTLPAVIMAFLIWKKRKNIFNKAEKQTEEI